MKIISSFLSEQNSAACWSGLAVGLRAAALAYLFLSGPVFLPWGFFNSKWKKIYANFHFSEIWLIFDSGPECNKCSRRDAPFVRACHGMFLVTGRSTVRKVCGVSHIRERKQKKPEKKWLLIARTWCCKGLNATLIVQLRGVMILLLLLSYQYLLHLHQYYNYL